LPHKISPFYNMITSVLRLYMNVVRIQNVYKTFALSMSHTKNVINYSKSRFYPFSIPLVTGHWSYLNQSKRTLILILSSLFSPPQRSCNLTCHWTINPPITLTTNRRMACMWMTRPVLLNYQEVTGCVCARPFSKGS
jgi:hypothetical protein